MVGFLHGLSPGFCGAAGRFLRNPGRFRLYESFGDAMETQEPCQTGRRLAPDLGTPFREWLSRTGRSRSVRFFGQRRWALDARSPRVVDVEIRGPRGDDGTIVIRSSIMKRLTVLFVGLCILAAILPAHDTQAGGNCSGTLTLHGRVLGVNGNGVRRTSADYGWLRND